MKRLEYDRYGGPDLMHLATFDVPEVGTGGILVRVRAASLNPVDWGIREGKMRLLTGSTFPRVMGKDFSGTIAQVGAGVTGWNVDDEVMGCVPWRTTGSFTPFALVRAHDIVRKPDMLSFPQAAALPTIGLTAWHGLIQKAGLEPGQSVLVNGAAGGVGGVVVQIARSFGAQVTARVGRRSFERMTEMSIANVLDYRGPLPAALNDSFDIIFDCNGSLTGHDIDRLLKPSGTAVDITLKPNKLLRSAFLRRQKIASGTVDQPTLQAVADFASTGKLHVDIGTEVPIEEAIPAIIRFETGEKIDGKVVIVFE